MNTIAPFWDGNETWLVIVGAGLFATFPVVYAVFLGAFYIPVLLLLIGLIFRGVAFEFRDRSQAHARLWDWAFPRLDRRGLRAGRRGGRDDARHSVADGQFAGGCVRLAAPVRGADRHRSGVRLCAARRRVDGGQERRARCAIGPMRASRGWWPSSSSSSRWVLPSCCLSTSARWRRAICVTALGAGVPAARRSGVGGGAAGRTRAARPRGPSPLPCCSSCAPS